MSLDLHSLVFSFYSPAVPGAEMQMRVTHIPSGTTVEGVGRSLIRLRAELLDMLEKAVNSPSSVAG